MNDFVGRNNAAKYYGGAIYSLYRVLSIENSTLTNNSAKDGGAIYADDVEIFTVKSNTFANNRASNAASAVYSVGSDLVYYDSIGCFDCKMKEFLSWGTMLNYFENSHQECPIYFVLSPKAADSARIFNSLSVLSEYGNITLDHDYAFARNNPILHDSKYRGLNYVVDSNNFVRLSGRFLRDRKDFKKCESFLLRYVK